MTEENKNQRTRTTSVAPLSIEGEHGSDVESQTSHISETQQTDENKDVLRNRAGIAAKAGGMILGAAGAVAENLGADNKTVIPLKASGMLLLSASLVLETKGDKVAQLFRGGAVASGVFAIALSNKPLGIAAIASQALASSIEVVPRVYSKAKECTSKGTIEEGSHARAETERRNNSEGSELSIG